MKKNSLTPNKGLSLSQAQSISNLCNQRAREIDAVLNNVNNYSKTVNIPNNNNGLLDSTLNTHLIMTAKKLPENVVEMLIEKARLFACVAFLRENMEAKNSLLNDTKKATADTSSVEIPEQPKKYSPLLNQLANVNEDFGWSQLTTAEVCEYLEAEAFAAHIGQFIHKNGTLDNLRLELPNIASIEWMELKVGEKTPVTINVHHKPEELLEIHEKLAKLHRQYEQRVNYFKAKVKNLTTEENARIAKVNADAQIEIQKKNSDLQIAYETAYKAANEQIKTITLEFEKERNAKIKQIAAMRINVDVRFQSVIDEFLGQLSSDQE